METLDFSVIIPVFNEEDNVEPLYKGLIPVMEGMGKSYEIIFVDDGSNDNTFGRLKTLAEKDPHLRMIRLARNFGQTSALQAGFDNAKGKVIVTMDGDLQNDPADIPKLLKKLEEGYDVVNGWRRHRKDSVLVRRLQSFVFNKLISFTTKIPIHDFACTLRAHRKEAIEAIKLYGEMHRYMPVLFASRGFSITEIEVTHHIRKHGKQKYGFSRIPRVLFDLIQIKFLLTEKPIRVVGIWGIYFVITAVITGIATLIMKLSPLKTDITGNPLSYLTILLIIVGIQFIALGLLGEIAVRTYFQSQDESVYEIKPQNNTELH